MEQNRPACEIGRDYGSIVVSVFRNVMTNGNRSLNVRERGELYKKDLCDVWEMTLREFLELGSKYMQWIEQLRSSEDNDERDSIKRRNLPAGVLSARVRNRMKELRMEDKLIEYNSIMVLDFDHLEDVDAVKELLKSVPYIWYVGKSVSGKGLFAIVPIASANWRDHEAYFSALAKDMKSIGLEVDLKCGDLLRTRVVSYDEAPYFNDGCAVEKTRACDPSRRGRVDPR